MSLPKKIAVIGPESTGKSSLCTSLAAHYKCRWVPEFAREYLIKNGSSYTFDSLLEIAKEQVASEDKLFQSAIENNEAILFVDTEMCIMKVWFEYVFHNCPSFVLNQLAVRQYDLYFLCAPDLPWVKDELREYPDYETRNKLYHYYKEFLINQQTPWIEITGKDDERIEKAIGAVDGIL